MIFIDIDICKGLIIKFSYFLENVCFGFDIEEKAKMESKWIFLVPNSRKY